MRTTPLASSNTRPAAPLDLLTTPTHRPQFFGTRALICACTSCVPILPTKYPPTNNNVLRSNKRIFIKTSISSRTMTQKETILKRLQNGEWLSSVQAVRELYIMRLGARIWDLRSEGYEIEERRVEGKSSSEYVLVQPEMERGRSPLVSIPPFGAGIFKASMSPPGYPSAWLRPRRARFRFARQDHCSSTTSIRLNFRMARHSGGTVKASLVLARSSLLFATK
jgi:Helix-turn-helix domain